MVRAVINEYSDNRIIKVLSVQNIFTEHSVKRAYRLLSKTVHPDITGKSSDDFIRLHEEYEQALAGIETIAAYFRNENMVSIGNDSRFFRLMFYLSLKRYATVGLFSVKLRIRESVRSRNRIILEDVVRRAQKYDESFVTIFLIYNQNHLQRFSSWLNNKSIKKGRGYFLKGLVFFLDYEVRGTKELYNIAHSYLSDALEELAESGENSMQKATLDFATWLYQELEKRSLHDELLK